MNGRPRRRTRHCPDGSPATASQIIICVTDDFGGFIFGIFCLRRTSDVCSAMGSRHLFASRCSHSWRRPQGVCWTTRPDGQPGWAEFLVEQGCTFCVVDGRGGGRSAAAGALLESRAEHIVAALVALVRQIGPALLVGHSFGGAIAAKVMDTAPKQVTGLISIAPAPHGNIANNRPLPNDTPIVFD